MRLHVGANGSWPIAFAVGSLIGYWMSTVASGMPIWKWRDTGKRQRLQHHVPDHFGKLGTRIWPSDAADPVFAGAHAFPNGPRQHQRLHPLHPKETAQHIAAICSFKPMG